MSFKTEEQRQSVRFGRQFMVTDHEDEGFQEPFVGFDVNLTGLSFWVDNADWFLPGQLLSLRVKNLDNEEEYCLDGVELIHIQTHDQKILCGCHITQVTSSQLLAHHRMVVTDERSAQQMNGTTELGDFDFDEEGAPSSENLSDFQELVMASLLQYEQLKKDSIACKRRVSELQTFVASYGENELKPEALLNELNKMDLEQDKVFRQHLAWSLFAKLLAFTPSDKADRQNWQTMISDFEALYLTDQQQVAFDFIHQGISARKSLAMARDYVLAQESPQLELDELSESS
ncbi:PilZ domain-containing protein [Thiomicrorhabdus indica]|uniref:PilZ domain-containing protein n=1 Tax=Thiomicrorhabdus indica TaxID=2267253 RepID=UPI002AA72E65|nr:PilZ domain-containing protein [Thiomicrorhabdus indica]